MEMPYLRKFLRLKQNFRKQKNLICIGECGLDYMWAKKSNNYEETKKRQQETFRRMINLANDMNLPVNTHSRRADAVVVKILKECKANKAVLHGFSGTIKDAKEAIALGYKIAIGANIYDWIETREYLKEFPIDAFVLNTDSPVMAPVKGERNEPANILFIVKEIAKIKNITEEEIIEATNKNVKELFGI